MNKDVALDAPSRNQTLLTDVHKDARSSRKHCALWQAYKLLHIELELVVGPALQLPVRSHWVLCLQAEKELKATKSLKALLTMMEGTFKSATLNQLYLPLLSCSLLVWYLYESEVAFLVDVAPFILYDTSTL